MTRSLHLDYAAPGTRSPRRRHFSFAAFFIAAVPIAALYVLIELYIPRAETLYKDFGMRLPAATQLVLDLARAGYRPNYLPAVALPLSLGLAIPLLTPRSDRNGPPPRRRRRRLWMGAAIALAAVLFVAGAVAVLVIPMTNLFAALSGGK